MRCSVFTIIRLSLYLLFIIVFVIVSFYKVPLFNCEWNDNFGIICPSCGATRATIALLKFNIPLAVNYNMFFTITIFPLALFLILNDIYIIISRVFTKKNNIG